MSFISFKDYSPPITSDELSDLESLIGCALPGEMVCIYKRYNGGQPIPSFVHDENNIYPINSFYSLDEIVDCYHDFDDDSLPDDFKKHELLPFAYDPGSGIYSISLRKEDFGKVYFYILLEQAEVFGVWQSFKSFIDSFVDDPNP